MHFFKVASWGVALALAVGGCAAGESNTGYNLAHEATFDEQPLDPDSIQAQLSRYKNQTKFLNTLGWYHRGGYADGRADNSAETSRGIQESDIYKLGKPGSQILFLLNNYRGLQVISFSDGPDQAKLLGRAEPTGNWPDDMYYDAEGDRIIVLERVQYDEAGQYTSYRQQNSRLLVYDVAEPSQPVLTEQVTISGLLADSRMVGDVLYVATRLMPHQQGDTGKGKIFSYQVSNAGVTEIANRELQLPISSRENMNIVEVEAEQGFEYYLIATLSASQWGWWDRQSTIEVVDITDAAGRMQPVLVAEAKGVVQERSQTIVKDGTLIVTSNYTSEATDLQRIAVETFVFPDGDSTILTSEEAEYRKVHADRELRIKRAELIGQGYSGDALADALEAYYEQLMQDEELGLAGRFVREGSTVRKPLADFATNVGSTRGLSASLQDVRYQDGLLYAFWVPANNIDPLDVFDISDPRTGAPHRAHLEFDGWIQNATPLSFAGEDYILGLGWVIPAVDNDRGRRFPQATLIKIQRDGEQISPQVMSTWRMPDSGVWANFNAADRFIDVRMDAAGSGSALFAFSSWQSGNYRSGGLLLGFDLSEPQSAFAEGSILEADAGWLRRVFHHNEIDRIHTFADRALGTYALDGEVGMAGRIVAATDVLELARNIHAYFSLPIGEQTLGVQVVSNYSWDSSDGASTELRLVDPELADAEVDQVISLAKVDGQYVSHLVVNHEVLLLTQNYRRIPTEDDYWTYEVDYRLSRFAILDNEWSEEAQLNWTADWNNDDDDLSLGLRSQMVRTPDGNILIGAANQVKSLVVTATDMQLTAVTLADCDLDSMIAGEIQVYADGIYVTYSHEVTDPDRPNLSLARNFLRPLSEVASTTLACGAPVNIPGRILQTTDEAIITSDQRVVDIRRYANDDGTVYYTPITDQVLASLTLGKNSASLRDLYDPDDVAVSNLQVDGDALVFIENVTREQYWPHYSDRFSDFPYYPHQSSEQRFVRLRLDAEMEFVRQVWVLDLDLIGGANLLGLFANGEYAVVGIGRQLQVLSLAAGERPTVVPVQEVEPDGTLSDPSDKLHLHSNFWYWRGNEQLHWTPELKSFELANGMYGVSQFYLAP